jgi:hypothetical protein
VSASPARPGLADRIERAFLIFAGAVLLGPLVPGLPFAAVAALGRLVPDGLGSVPALSFATTARDVLLASYFDGGGLASLVAGGILGGAVLWRGGVGVAPALLIVGLVAAGPGAPRLHGVPLRFGAAMVLAFVLVAVASAGALIKMTARLGLLRN